MSSKKYLFGLILFGALAITLTVIAEFLVRRLPTPYSDKYKLLQNPNYSTLILGSSHTYYGLDPKIFLDPTINAANVSQDLKYDLFLLKTSLQFNKHIEHVIIPLSTFSLTTELESGQESWRKFNYSIFMGYKEPSIANKLDIRNYSAFLASPSQIASLMRGIFSLSSNPIMKDWTPTGFGTGYQEPGTLETLFLTGKSAAERHQKHSEHSSTSMESLMKIAQLCRQHNIKLIIITTPAHYYYRKYINANRLRDIAIQAKSLQSANTNIRYLDYFNDSRFLDIDFHDADHLSHSGAEKLSHLINSVLDSR